MQRSTEQLTRCSTISLEEGIAIDKEGNVVENQTIPKIMSVCKNTIRWVILIDVLLALIVIVLLGLLEFGDIPRNHIGFLCNDPKLSFKFTGDTISFAVLLSVSAFIPVLVMWIIEYAGHANNSYDTETDSNNTRIKQIWFWYSHYVIGIVTLALGCNVMKIVIGEPRPHFFHTCQPLEAQNCKNEYIEKYTCTNSDDSNWFIQDSSKSFPSGHSALSVFTSIFIVVYVQQRMTDRTLLLKPCLQFIISMWGVICSLSRIGDNRHHWWDVLAGLVIGSIMSILIVVYPCRVFRLERKILSSKQIRSDFIGNDQVICFDDKNYHSKKKLVNSANNVDIPEGRELRDITVSWKE